MDNEEGGHPAGTINDEMLNVKRLFEERINKFLKENRSQASSTSSTLKVNNFSILIQLLIISQYFTDASTPKICCRLPLASCCCCSTWPNRRIGTTKSTEPNEREQCINQQKNEDIIELLMSVIFIPYSYCPGLPDFFFRIQTNRAQNSDFGVKIQIFYLL